LILILPCLNAILLMPNIFKIKFFAFIDFDFINLN
jgi:hypothetical protein